MKEKLGKVKENLEGLAPMYGNQLYIDAAESTKRTVALIDSIIAMLDSMTSEEKLEEIVNKGYFDFNTFDRKRGSARGQVITGWDSPDQWIAKAAIEAIKGEANG